MNLLTFDATDQNFEAQVLHAALPVLVEFTAEWCPPCKRLAPIVHEIAQQYAGKLRVGLLDSDANPETVQRYAVMGLPTLILFVDGSPVERIVGYSARERITARLAPHLVVEEA